MQNKKIYLILAIIIVLILLLVKFGAKAKNNEKGVEVATDKFRIVSTNPEPLSGATILPNQYLEFTFNKPLFRSEFKHRFDPEVEHEVQVINGRDHEFGQIFRIVFKKPLELGAGYTLFVEDRTITEEKETLDKEYNYHFQTIKYKGI